VWHGHQLTLVGMLGLMVIAFHSRSAPTILLEISDYFTAGKTLHE
jgi:hypothetical protein